MTEEQFGLIFFALVIGGAYWFRQWYHAQPRRYKVSEQLSGGKILIVTELNPRWESAAIELTVKSKYPLAELAAFIEFISPKGEAQKLSLNDLGIEEVSVEKHDDRKLQHIRFEKRDLMRGIRQCNIQPFRFRFVVIDADGQIIKSHLFGFSTKYMLFRPDTGRYN